MPIQSQSLNKFVARYAVREVYRNEKGESETAIYLTENKTFCTESEQHKFYAKIGGLLNLEDLNSEKVKELLQKLDIQGFHLVLTNYRTTKGRNKYAVIFPQINTKTLQIPISPLVSFLPRIDGHTGEVICALRISSAADITKRDWTRFVGSTKSIPKGFHELKFGYNYDEDYKKKTKAKYVGFYVNANASLMVYDIGTIDPNKAVNPEQNRTLIQEGGFVYADVDLLFRNCSDTEDKLYTANELYQKFKDTEKSCLGSDRYKKSHLIRDNKEPKQRSVIFFLKTTPFLMPYELHITDDLSKNALFKGKRTAVLTIPSGGEFEYCEFWQLMDGIEIVAKRQKTQPWNKYLQKESDAQSMSFEEKISDIPFKSFPTVERNEKTPQNEEMFKNIKKIRKQIVGGKTGSPNDSQKNKPQNEVKPTTEESDKPKQDSSDSKTPSLELKTAETGGQQKKTDKQKQDSTDTKTQSLELKTPETGGQQKSDDSQPPQTSKPPEDEKS